MRIALGIVVGLVVGALVATLLWFYAFGNVVVRDVDDGPVAVPGESATTPRETGRPAPQPAEPGQPSPDIVPPVISGAILAIPVAGVSPSELVDTYSESRAGGTRRHDAIDIMAPDGTVVTAAAPGTIEKLFYSDQGGITVYVRSRDRRWIHYYAHLDRYAPGLLEGQEVATGDPLGLVGSTGNADPDAPHLHFAVMRMREGESWWEGEAVNPYPMLTGG